MLRIINGEVYDPINNINGEVREICVDRRTDCGFRRAAAGQSMRPGWL